MKDVHLNTGEYDPKKYWEARAKASQGNIYQAVCVFGYTDEENSAAEKLQKHFFDILTNIINLEGTKVLEFGCGVGRWASIILKRGAIYYGVDISDSMLDMARNLIPKAEFYKIDSYKLPFKDNEFDMVFTITVLHHNPYEQQTKIIDELIRVTRPNGYILLMEGIYPKKMQTSFNMFPRPVDDWIEEVTKNNRAQVVKIKFIHWWILRDIVFALIRKMGISKASRENMKMLNSFLVRAGSYVDKYLIHLLPRRLASNAGMLFMKQSKRFQ